MKRFRILALVALVLCTTHQSAHALGVFASWWQMDESKSDGFGFGINERINISHFGIEGRASWISFSDVTPPSSEVNPPADNSADVIPLEAMGVVSLHHFYGGVGVGYYIFDADAAELSDEVGWFAVVGVELGLGPAKLFGDVKWTQVETTVEGTAQSVTADGVGVNVGIALRI